MHHTEVVHIARISNNIQRGISGRISPKKKSRGAQRGIDLVDNSMFLRGDSNGVSLYRWATYTSVTAKDSANTRRTRCDHVRARAPGLDLDDCRARATSCTIANANKPKLVAVVRAHTLQLAMGRDRERVKVLIRCTQNPERKSGGNVQQLAIEYAIEKIEGAIIYKWGSKK